MATNKTNHLLSRAYNRIPGGVNSPVRSWKAVGGTPRFIQRGKGAYLVDLEGKKYLDYLCSWGPLILGHADQRILTAVNRAAARGTTFGAPTEGEVVLAERCWLSTMAYQCLAPTDPRQRVPLEEVERITRQVHGDTWPNKVFLLDVNQEIRKARASSGALDRVADRIEAKSDAFHQAVRQAYLELAAADPRI
ncbi:MAG: aminotransferase class III-fold pyridoxal phosphate-dependent enzyme, partial [Candidatus Binatia bacterium]